MSAMEPVKWSWTLPRLDFNPYILPPGNVLVSFSGGRTSGYMLHHILQANDGLPATAKVVFCNTGREDHETLDFVQACSDRWNVQITWLEYRRIGGKVAYETVNHNSASRNGEPFQALIDSKHGYLPNQQARYCTEEMKVRTIKRYLVSEGWQSWVNTVGIRADEGHRVRDSKDKRWRNWYPLADAMATKQDIMAFWSAQPFDLQIVPGRGNCVGCFLKSEATLAAHWRDDPAHMQWWADQESAKGSTFHKSRSYAQLGDFVKRQSDWIFDDEAFLCQVDGGECSQ